MGAMPATRYNPILKAFFNRLVEENHRPKKVTLVSVMRKLVIAANYAVKNLILCLQINTATSKASNKKRFNDGWKTLP